MAPGNDAAIPEVIAEAKSRVQKAAVSVGRPPAFLAIKATNAALRAIGQSSRLCDLFGRDRQDALKLRPVFAIRHRGKVAAVALDYPAANRQAEAHAIGFCRDERIEYAFELFWIDARS